MNKMKRAIKHILLCLVFGLVIAWIVPSALLEIPRRIGSQRFLKSQMISDADARLTRILDYRWFGVYERQFTQLRKFNTADQRTRLEFWWTMHVLPRPNLPLEQAWEEIRSRYDADAFPVEESQYSIVHVGWPMLSFRMDGAINIKGTLSDGTYPKDVHGAVVTPVIDPAKYFKGMESSPLATHLWVPYHPIWSGLFVNTVFYALIIAMVLSIKRAYRHARRMRKGNCPICSYYLEFVFVDGCPECGWRKD